MGNDLLAVFYIFKKEFYIYGCYDKDTSPNEYDFYDIYEDGNCINEGCPLYDFPKWHELKEFIEENDI